MYLYIPYIYIFWLRSNRTFLYISSSSINIFFIRLILFLVYVNFNIKVDFVLQCDISLDQTKLMEKLIMFCESMDHVINRCSTHVHARALSLLIPINTPHNLILVSIFKRFNGRIGRLKKLPHSRALRCQ
jgi:hypothetical protein